MAAAPEQLASLRHLIAGRFPAPPRPAGGVLPTGVPALDEAAGGLPLGAVTELVAAPGAGGQSVLARILGAARATRQRVALIDATDAFAPEAVEQDELRHLVWARARNVREAFAVADVLMRDGNFSSVILDIRDVPVRELKRTPKSNWHRFHRVAERQPAAVLVMSSFGVVPAVRWRLTLAAPWSLTELHRTREALACHLAVEAVRGPRREEMAG